MIIKMDDKYKTFPKDEFVSRINKLQERMKEESIDVLLLTTPENIYYTVGYRSWYLSSLFRPVFAIVPKEGDPAIVLRILEKSTVKFTSWTNRIYVTGSANRDLGKLDAENHIDAVLKAINDVCPDCKKVGYEKAEGGQFYWSLDLLEELKSETEELEYVDGTKAIQKARMIKSEWEIEQLSTAAIITERAVLETFKKVIPGKTTEKDVSRSIASLMTAEGIDKISYLTVTSGIEKYTTLNAYATDRIIQKGELLLVDISGHYNGYASDITRMLYCDYEIPKEIDSMAKVSSDSVETGIKSLKVGAKISDLNKSVEKVIKDSKYADYLIHSSGHGVGLNVVEHPFLSDNSDEVIQKGMVLAIENGVYPFDKEDGAENMHLAFRMEEEIVVTNNGYKRLTGPSKHLYSLKDFIF